MTHAQHPIFERRTFCSFQKGLFLKEKCQKLRGHATEHLNRANTIKGFKSEYKNLTCINIARFFSKVRLKAGIFNGPLALGINIIKCYYFFKINK
jgi:hypothetical protein